MSKFPKDLYVKRANKGSRDEYLAADADVTTLLEQGERTTIARYALVETCEGWLSPEIRKIRKAK